MTHLTEAERQDLADGSAPAELARALESHVAGCAGCAADVERLRAVVARLRSAPEPNDNVDTMWPAIRDRIERGKLASLPAPAARRARTWRQVWIGGGAAAAAVCVVLLLEVQPHEPAGQPPPAGHTVPNGQPGVQPISDTAGESQADVQRLLDEIELEKAMLPPATAAVADSDLRVIDRAIAELKDALARDPNNPALRQMLADSYRQQQDLLRRMHNVS